MVLGKLPVPGRPTYFGLNIFISYYNYTSIQIYMKIIQAMGLERKLKAYKVLLPEFFSQLILIIVRQGPTALTVGAGGGCFDIFTLVYQFSFLSPSLWETALYRLKYCLKGPLSWLVG